MIENKKLIFKKIKIENNKIIISKLNMRSVKKVIKKLKKYNIKNIVCCNEIMKNKNILNYISANNIHIYNGRILYKYIIKNIIDYLRNKNLNLERMSAAILVNNNSTLNIQIIYLISNIFKNLTIVTNNSKKFMKIEKELEEDGIPVNISNNKKKSLKKINIIFNIDFSGETLNQFKIYNYAIILNIEEKIKIENKQFEGIIINNYNIDFEDKLDEYNNYNKNFIYEGMFLENLAYCHPSELKIKELIGNKGFIQEDEYKRINKNI